MMSSDQEMYFRLTKAPARNIIGVGHVEVGDVFRSYTDWSLKSAYERADAEAGARAEPQATPSVKALDSPADHPPEALDDHALIIPGLGSYAELREHPYHDAVTIFRDHTGMKPVARSWSALRGAFEQYVDQLKG